MDNNTAPQSQALCLPIDPNVADHGNVAVASLYAAENVVKMERRQANGWPLAHLDPSPKQYRNYAKRTGVDLALMDKAAQEIRDGKRPLNCLRPEGERLYVQADNSVGNTPQGGA